MIGKAPHTEQFRARSKHQICHRMGFSIQTPEVSFILYILYKLHKSCGQLEPKLSKIEQFLASKIGKLLYTLNVCRPCISSNPYSGASLE